MSDQPTWSVPGGPLPPPPTGTPYDVAPPGVPAWTPGPGTPGPGGPGGPRRRGRLLLAAATTLVVLVGAGAGVVLARTQGTGTPTAAATPSPATPSPGTPSPATTATTAPPAPSTTAVPDPATPTALGTSPVGSEFAPAPSAPAPVVVRVGTGAIGAALTARGFQCAAKHSGPTIVGCYALTDRYSSVEWIGTSEKPVSVSVVVQGSLDEAAALERALPASAGVTGSAVDALVASARKASGHKAGSGPFQVQVFESTQGPRAVVEVTRVDADSASVEFRRAELPAGFAAAERAATQHRYTCTRGTEEGRVISTCRYGARTLELVGDGADELVTVFTTTPEATDDLLRLFTEVGGDFGRPSSQTLIGLVAAVQDGRIAVAAAGGFEAMCFGDGGRRSCSVGRVDW